MGAGAESSNVILGDTTAYVEDSSLNSDVAIQLTATDTSSISATVVAASIGSGSIGASVSDNFIGYNSDGDRVGNKIHAFSRNSRINAVGALEVDADSSATIKANVIAASIAVAKASGNALSGAGSGVSTTNRVGQDVQAYLDGDAQLSAPLASGINAASVTLSATDTSVITAYAGAAALALSFGAKSGNLTIGIGLARNVIDNDVEASIRNVHQNQLTTPANSDGLVKLTATSHPSITAYAWAATVGFASGGVASVSLSGAGAEAVNVILGSTTAYITDSVLDVSGDTLLTATTDGAVLDATVWGAAVSLAAGGGAGGGVSIGSAMARNYVGMTEDGETSSIFAVQAYVRNSSIITAGDLKLIASLSSTIDSTVVSAAVAFSQTPLIGGAGSGAGASSENIVNSKVHAFLNGDANNSAYLANGLIQADKIELSATDQSTITAFTGAAALAASVGQASIAVTISTGLAWNTILNDVKAYVAHIDQSSSRISNSLTVVAESQATITANAWAASVSATSGAAGLNISGAGADARNVIRGNVDAYIQDSDFVVGGEVAVSSTQSSIIDSTIWAAAGSFSSSASTSAGLAIGTATAVNYVGFSDDGEQIGAFRVSAYIKNSSLDVLGQMTILANMSAVIDATVAAGSVAISGGSLSSNAAAAGSGVENKISTQVMAYLDGTRADSDFQRSTGVHAGAISLDAHDNSTITAWAGTASVAGSVGTVSGAFTIAAATAINTISNEVGTYIIGYPAMAGTPGVSTKVTLDSSQTQKTVLKPGDSRQGDGDGLNQSLPVPGTGNAPGQSCIAGLRRPDEVDGGSGRKHRQLAMGSFRSLCGRRRTSRLQVPRK